MNAAGGLGAAGQPPQRQVQQDREEHQRCIVHQIRNSRRVVAAKNHKAFLVDLRLTRTRGGFPNDDSLLKLLHIGIINASRKWTMPIQKECNSLGNAFNLQSIEESDGLKTLRRFK